MKLVVKLRIIIFIHLLLIIVVNGDLYSSTEELLNSSEIKRNIKFTLDKLIEREVTRLNELESIKYSFDEFYNVNTSKTTKKTKILDLSTSSRSIDEDFFHPVKAFAELNHLVNTIEQIDEIVGGSVIASEYDMFKELLKWYNAPNRTDLVGAGEALLRLQIFYNLNSSDIASGKLYKNLPVSLRNSAVMESIGSNEPKLRGEDCFELGKIAYDKNLYDAAIIWFGIALEMYNEKGLFNEDTSPREYSQVNELIDYMAFSTYQKGNLELAIEFTEELLERDPHNERALENLEFYREELERQNETEGSSTDKSTSEESIGLNDEKFYYEKGESFDTSGYVLEQDYRVRELCRNSFVAGKSNKCSKEFLFTNHMIEPVSKIEILKTNPKILRIHDIITEDEVEHLKKAARPTLSRSTVKSKYGAVTSSYRIAKTAWLSRDTDPVVARLEKRLGGLLNLDFSASESLQVVNYGIGGYYGPHLDATRETKDPPELDNRTILYDDDRFATVLIYLNPVEAGGATVFPRLGVTAEPIERSAIVWYNILESGLSDERTLHTGCPVLFGSKWIATFWPRERANTFRKLCPLKRDNLTD